MAPVGASTIEQTAFRSHVPGVSHPTGGPHGRCAGLASVAGALLHCALRKGVRVRPRSGPWEQGGMDAGIMVEIGRRECGGNPDRRDNGQ